MARRPDLSHPPVRRPRTPSEPEKRRPVAANGLAAAIGTHSASEYGQCSNLYGIGAGPRQITPPSANGTLSVYSDHHESMADETLVCYGLVREREAEAVAALPDILIDRDNLIYHCEKIIHEQKCGRVAMDPWYLKELVSLIEKNKKSMPA